MMMGRPCSTGLGPPKSSGAVTKDRRPTLETIATAVGVSLPTVPEVLNYRADVSAATRHWCSGFSCSTSTCHLGDPSSAGPSGTAVPRRPRPPTKRWSADGGRIPTRGPESPGLPADLGGHQGGASQDPTRGPESPGLPADLGGHQGGASQDVALLDRFHHP